MSEQVARDNYCPHCGRAYEGTFESLRNGLNQGGGISLPQATKAQLVDIESDLNTSPPRLRGHPFDLCAYDVDENRIIKKKGANPGDPWAYFEPHSTSIGIDVYTPNKG